MPRIYRRRTVKGSKEPVATSKTRFKKKANRHSVIQKMMAVMEEFAVDTKELEKLAPECRKLLKKRDAYLLLQEIDKVAGVLGYKLELVSNGRGVPDERVTMTHRQKYITNNTKKTFDKKNLWSNLEERKRDEERIRSNAIDLLVADGKERCQEGSCET